MKKLLSIIFIIQLSFATLNNVFSQEVRINDSLRSGSVQQSKTQNTNKAQAKPDGSQARGNQEIKKIQGSHPDMSKTKGARPPQIVRPSGSRIPKGMGKPGGAVKKGGR